MNRPITRPTKPYTAREILDMARKHFVKDKSPRCVFDTTNCCLYSQTGCFIGFLLTREDAEAIEHRGGILDIINTHPHIIKHYFDIDNNRMRAFLRLGQAAHDMYFGNDNDFRTYMDSWLETMDQIANELGIL